MIREFNRLDLEEVNRLIHTTIDISYTGIYPDRAVKFFKDYHSPDKILTRNTNGRVLILLNDCRIIGTGSIVSNEISGVFINPSSQGRGCGKMIMQELEDHACNEGLTELMLHISLPSRQFYEKLNYMVSEPMQLDLGEGEMLKYWEGRKLIENKSAVR